jgi:hypothetical protein
MSIPHYQEQSLQGENIAKSRVMKRAKKGFESEEQRAIKSGQVIDELKTSYRTIVQNLQLQLLTMSLTKSTIVSIVSGLGGRHARPRTEDGEEREAYIAFEDDEEAVTGNLHSLLIGSLGKLVTLSSQLRILCGNLYDKAKETGRPVTGSADLSKINSLFADVEKAFGSGGEGYTRGLSEMLDMLKELGGNGVPQVENLMDLYARNMVEAYAIIGKLQRNEYETDYQKVYIPSKSTTPARLAGIADGSERREFTGEEYKTLVELRDLGLLRGDDFTSVYSGDRGDDSTIGSSRSGSSRSSRSSKSSRSSRSSRSSGSSSSSSGIRFRPERGFTRVPIRPTRFDPLLGTISASDDSSYQEGFDSSSDGTGSDSGMYIDYREPDSDDDTDYSGSGLYSIPASKRYPLRIH